MHFPQQRCPADIAVQGGQQWIPKHKLLQVVITRRVGLL